MDISCSLKLIKFTRAQVKLIWAQALIGPGVDTPLIICVAYHVYLGSLSPVMLMGWLYKQSHAPIATNDGISQTENIKCDKYSACIYII